MKKIEIEIPEGCALIEDGKNYKIVKIENVLPANFRSLGKISGWFVGIHSDVKEVTNISAIPLNYNLCATKQQAEGLLALAHNVLQISEGKDLETKILT